MIIIQRNLSKSYSQLRGFTCSSVLPSKRDKIDKNNENTLSKEEVTNKLNDLLNEMIQKDDDPKKDIQLPQAVKHKRLKPERQKPLGEKLELAAKDVATSLGGDVVKTESELLKILLRKSDPSTQVLQDVLKGIKVEKSSEPESRAKQVRDVLARQPVTARYLSELPASAQMKLESRKPKKISAALVDILGTAPSSYFKDFQPQPTPCDLSTWNSCKARDIRLAVTHPPTNIYEQMILWTNQGMLWRFPIDNEQGLDEEKQVPFEDHIFLEHHLEGWCPEMGPVRHFMELVCVGLSKNHWLTVEEKKNHIIWYRDYFADKKDLLKELGAGAIAVDSGEQKDVDSGEQKDVDLTK